MPGFKERGGIVLDRATHNHFHVNHPIIEKAL
jgi:hypothetical protein